MPARRTLKFPFSRGERHLFGGKSSGDERACPCEVRARACSRAGGTLATASEPAAAQAGPDRERAVRGGPAGRRPARLNSPRASKPGREFKVAKADPARVYEGRGRPMLGRLARE